MSRAAALSALLALLVLLLGPPTAPAATPQKLTLTVAAGTGFGKVSSSPAGIEGCESTCEAEFPEGSTVVLTAAPDPGSETGGWEACPGTENAAHQCEITMGEPREARLRFSLGWHSEQPIGPAGRAPLGEIGDLKCWEANRCALITPGNEGMPAGVYAYDGRSWYLYSTVCGGHEGSIAWAGPDDFWTVSDQPAGQERTSGSTTEPFRRSLCHFRDGAVVASYAEPLGVATSYLKMNAAACNGPDECWFGGERLPGTGNVGAFHLYWNGLSLSAVPSLTTLQPGLEDPGRTVTGLAFHQGRLYEGVAVQSDDQVPGESEPSVVHRVVPGLLPEFDRLETSAPIDYGEPGAEAEDVGGFKLSDDGSGLWAAAGTTESNLGAPTVLRLEGSALRQVQLAESSPLGTGVGVMGLGAVPGAAATWIGFRLPADRATAPSARLVLVHADGSTDPPIVLPAAGEGLANTGFAGPIACPTAGQCWMGTKSGWLFHMGSDPVPNDDPAMHTLITSRPRDNSLPSVPPLTLPVDDSGAEAGGEEETDLAVEEEPLPRHRPPLLSKLHQRLLGRRTLLLTFHLRQKAQVRLVAKHKGRVVAKTKRYTMGKGSHRIRLRLDPERWPTKLDLQVHAFKKKKGS